MRSGSGNPARSAGRSTCRQRGARHWSCPRHAGCVVAEEREARAWACGPGPCSRPTPPTWERGEDQATDDAHRADSGGAGRPGPGLPGRGADHHARAGPAGRAV
jgi:hypothetical protein